MKELVQEAIADFHSKTCVVFEPYDGTQHDYVVVTNIDSTDCSSFIGRLGGKQTVNLMMPGCERVFFFRSSQGNYFYTFCVSKIGTVVHEFMHAIGFFHEQSRMDRDDYVDIIWENIELGTNQIRSTTNPGFFTY